MVRLLPWAGEHKLYRYKGWLLLPRSAEPWDTLMLKKILCVYSVNTFLISYWVHLFWIILK